MTEKSETRKFLEEKIAEMELQNNDFSETENDGMLSDTEEVAREEDFSELPKSFKKEMAEIFKQLPEEMQKYLHEKDKEDCRKFEEFQKKLDERKWIDEICSYHEPRLRRCGIDNVCDWLKHLADLDEAMDCNPQAVLHYLSRVYGVFVPLKSQELEGNDDANRRMQEAWEIVSRFLQAADEQGNARYPYADIVREQMAGLLKCGASTCLEDAYDKAIWLNDQVREKLIKERAEAELKEKAKEAEKAKQAGFAPKGHLSKDDMSKLSTRELLQHLIDD